MHFRWYICNGVSAGGACGFGELGRELNGGDVGAASRLYRNGTGCGACYKIRCRHPELCSDDGAKIVVTDYGQGDYTGFILSARGFAKLAVPPGAVAAELMDFGVIDVEYRRIPCQFPGHNMMFKVTEHNKFPDYLSLIITYQAVQKDVLAVDLWQEDCREWRAMRRAHGATWDVVLPPKGPIDVRLLIADDDGRQSTVELKGLLPCDWKAGESYDSSTQLN